LRYLPQPHASLPLSALHREGLVLIVNVVLERRAAGSAARASNVNAPILAARIRVAPS
jgi:hypothetical protein